MAVRIWRWIVGALSGEGSASLSARGPYDRRDWITLSLLLVLALIARVAVSALLPSVHHPDETFQYWEQAYRLSFGYGMIPWEYRTGIRSYVLPGALAGVMRVVSALGGGPATWQAAIQILLSLLSLSIVATAFAWARRVGGRTAALLAGLIAACWFELIYFGGKPLTESIAASLLFPAAYLLCLRHPSRASSVLGGFLLGLTFVIRFQLAPAVLLVALSCILVYGWRRSLPAALVTVAVILFGGAVDWLTLGSWFQSVWLNFVVNAVHDKASSYGVEPVWWFLREYSRVWAGIVAVLVVCGIAGLWRAPILLILAAAIVLAHSAIGHKEYRFVLPALPFLLTLFAIGMAWLFDLAVTAYPRGRRLAGAVLSLVLVATSWNLAVQAAFRDNWSRSSTAIEAFRMAGDVGGSCGIGLAGIGWVDTPGYRGLGHDVPVYPLTSEEHATELEPAFNVVVRRGSGWPGLRERYQEVGCSGNICVAVRPGACTPVPNQTVNPYLERKGE